MSEARVFVVAPPRKGSDELALLEEKRVRLQSLVASQGWTLKTYRLKHIKNAKPGGILVLDALDATTLYRALHHGDCAVVQVGTNALVPLHPKYPNEARHAVPLEKFVRYKAIFERVNGRVAPDDAVASISALLAESGCEGESDPRCLPMHVFDPEHEHSACPLTDAARVRSRYGGPQARMDAKQRKWSPTRGHAHGNDNLTVRGYQLQTGYHWDVSAARNVSELITTSEIWRMPSASYLNVSPDANVRGGQSSAVSAKKVFTLAGTSPDRKRVKGGVRG